VAVTVGHGPLAYAAAAQRLAAGVRRFPQLSSATGSGNPAVLNLNVTLAVQLEVKFVCVNLPVPVCSSGTGRVGVRVCQ